MSITTSVLILCPANRKYILVCIIHNLVPANRDIPYRLLDAITISSIETASSLNFEGYNETLVIHVLYKQVEQLNVLSSIKRTEYFNASAQSIGLYKAPL